MTRRLERLEAPYERQWVREWQDFQRVLAGHFDGIPLDALDLYGHDDLERFRLSHGLPNTAALEAWFTLTHASIPDASDFAKASMKWPRDLPLPPPEPDGLFDELTPLLGSSDPVARCYAQLTICVLASARAITEYKS